jgi:multidrug efflux pump subunit AcrA (membrane-fusion protein)
VHEGDKTYVWRIENGVLNKVNLVIGERDPRRGDYAVNSGLADGDKIIRRPISKLRIGQKIILAPAIQSTTQSPA